MTFDEWVIKYEEFTSKLLTRREKNMMHDAWNSSIMWSGHPSPKKAVDDNDDSEALWV